MKTTLFFLFSFVLIIICHSQTSNEYYKRAQEKSYSGDNLGAIADYIKSIENNTKDTLLPVGGTSFYVYSNAITYCNIGWTKSELKDYKGAIDYFTKGIELSPYSTFYCGRGMCKDSLHDYVGAIKDYSKAIELESNFTQAYVQRGDAKSNLNDYRGAIADYSIAIEQAPKAFYSYFKRGNAKYLLQDYFGAIFDYTKDLENYPKDEASYYNRGLAYIYIHQINSGCMDLSKAGELGDAKAYDAIKKYCQ
jgi:tetratricopeptide (TPR) repeat protein